MMALLRGVVVVAVCAGAIALSPRLRVTYDAWRLMRGDVAALAILDKEHRRRILERFVMDGAARHNIKLPVLPDGSGVMLLGEPVRLVLFVGPPEQKTEKGGQERAAGAEVVTLDKRGTIALVVADATTNWFSIQRLLQQMRKENRLTMCPYLALAALNQKGNLVWIVMELQLGRIRLGWETYYYLILRKGAAYVNGDISKTPSDTWRRANYFAKTVKPPPRFRVIVEWSVPYGSLINHTSAVLGTGCSLYYRLYGEKEVSDIHRHFNALDNGTWKTIFGPPEEEPIGEEEEEDWEEED